LTFFSAKFFRPKIAIVDVTEQQTEVSKSERNRRDLHIVWVRVTQPAYTTTRRRAMTRVVSTRNRAAVCLWKRETAAHHVAHVNGRFRVSRRVQHVGEYSRECFSIVRERHGTL